MRATCAKSRENHTCDIRFSVFECSLSKLFLFYCKQIFKAWQPDTTLNSGAENLKQKIKRSKSNGFSQLKNTRIDYIIFFLKRQQIPWFFTCLFIEKLLGKKTGKAQKLFPFCIWSCRMQ